MANWCENGLLISLRSHGEHGGIAGLFTENYGRHMGYLRGATSAKKAGEYACGNLMSAAWHSKTEDNLGYYTLDLVENYSVRIMDEPPKLLALQSLCALLTLCLPEKEPHAPLYHGTVAFLEMLDGPIWAEGYVMWEMALLKELGFGIDTSRCAGGGDAERLAYISPKSGSAVSSEKGLKYQDKLLKLPGFLIGNQDSDHVKAVHDGLKIGSYFLEHRVLQHLNMPHLPEPRLRLEQYFLPKTPQTSVHDAI